MSKMYDLSKNRVRKKTDVYWASMVLLWAGNYRISLNFEIFCLLIILLNKHKNMLNPLKNS